MPMPRLAPVQPDPTGAVWRGLAGPFACTGSGGDFILSASAAQTVDGTRKLCHACNTARLDDIWDARPAGLYGVAVNGQSAGYVEHTPVMPHPYVWPQWDAARRCTECDRPESARAHR